MNMDNLTNCGSTPPMANPALMGMGQNRFAGRVFSFFDFDKVIKDTLQDDVVIKNVRQTSPYFGGSAFSFNNVIANSLYYQYLTNYLHVKVMYAKMATIRHHYLVNKALQVMANDSLAADPFTGRIFTVTVDDKHPYSTKANLLIDQFMRKHQIDREINRIAPDAIFYGEYAFSLQSRKGTDKGEFQGKSEAEAGIVRVVDANPPGTILGVWDTVHPKYYVRLKKGINTTVQGQLEKIEPTSIWHIGIAPRTLPLSLGYGSWVYDDTNRIGHYLRVGEPLFYPVYNKIIELEAFEQAQLQKELGDLRRRGLVSVQAPAGIDLDQERDYARYYEGIINETNGPVDVNNIVGLEAVGRMMSTLSMARVIPQYPDRGKVEAIDLKIAADNIAEKIADRRRIILESIGIAYEDLYGKREGGKINLRQKVQYTRMIKRIQDGVAWSLQRLLRTHLSICGIHLEPQEINVKFYQAINVAEVDVVEAMDAYTQYMASFYDLCMEKMANSPLTSKYINVSEHMRLFGKVFDQSLGAKNLMIVPEGENKTAYEIGMEAQQEAAQMQQQMGVDPNAQAQQADGQQQAPVAQQPAQAAPVGLPPGVSVSNNPLPLNVRTTNAQLPPNVRVNS